YRHEAAAHRLPERYALGIMTRRSEEDAVLPVDVRNLSLRHEPFVQMDIVILFERLVDPVEYRPVAVQVERQLFEITLLADLLYEFHRQVVGIVPCGIRPYAAYAEPVAPFLPVVREQCLIHDVRDDIEA